MLEFSQTTARSAAIQRQLSDQFTFASRMFDNWMERPKGRWLRRSDLPHKTLDLSMLLNVQACRQFRTIVELCKTCEGFNASILARSLYETVLASQFILKPTFYLVIESKLDATGQPSKWYALASKKGVRKVALSRGKRASLYAAHCVFEWQELLTRYGDGFMGGAENLFDPAKVTEIVNAAEGSIGTKWTYILRHSPTYSGLKIFDLAKASGKAFREWYDFVYSDQSTKVHGAGAFQHLVMEAETGSLQAAWLSTDHDVWEALYCANTLFLIFVTYLIEVIDFGWATDELVGGMKEEFLKVYDRAT
jgi:hypothetical protein